MVVCLEHLFKLMNILLIIIPFNKQINEFHWILYSALPIIYVAETIYETYNKFEVT